MTWFDIVVIAVVGLSTAFAVVRGGLREVGTLVVLAAAGGAAVALVNPVQAAFGLKGSFLSMAAVGGVLAGAGFVILYFLLHAGLKRLPLAGRALTIDRVAGGVFGFARGLALIGLGFLAYSYYLDEARRPEAVASALTLPVANGLAAFFEGFAPQGSGLDAQAAAATPANAAADGYARQDRSALSEIVTTVTTTDGPQLGAVQPAGASDDEAAGESDPE
jgi:membrane protein required for colicin V production